METTLPYQPATEKRAKRWGRRIFLTLAIAFALFVSYLQIERAWPGWQTWWRYRQVAAFRFPEGQIVFDASSAAVAAVNPADPTEWVETFFTRVINPPPQDGTTNAMMRAVVREPPLWPDLARKLPQTWRRSGLVFLHERRAPGGQRILVRVAVENNGGMRIVPTTYAAATLTKPPYYLSGREFFFDTYHQAELKLTAGQPDPNDPSRFTIDYTYRGQRGVIEGRVTDEGTAVLMPSTGWTRRTRQSDFWEPDDYAAKLVEVSTPLQRLTKAKSNAQPPEKLTNSVQGMGFTPDGKLLLVGRRDGIHAYDPASGKQSFGLNLPQNDYDLTSIALSLDGTHVAANAATDLHVWELPGRSVRTYAKPRPGSGDLTFTRDGKRLLMTGGKSLYSLDLASGEASAQFDFGQHIRSISVSPDGQALTMHGESPGIRLAKVDLASKAVSGRTFRYGMRFPVKLSNDGKLIVMPGKVLDASTFNPLLTRNVPDGVVDGSPADAAMSPNGRAFAAIAWREPFRGTYQAAVWDFPAGNTLWLFRDPEGDSVTSLAFSPDGKMLATGHMEGSVILWSLDAALHGK